MGKKFTLNDVRAYIESNGCKWLSGEYKNRDSKLEILFPCQHAEIRGFHYFQQRNKLCSVCIPKSKGKAPKMVWNISLVKKFVKDNGNGDKLISKIFVNCKTRLIFFCYRCKKKYSMIWSSFRIGYRCESCGHQETAKKRRLKIDDVRSLFENKGYQFISTEYINGGEKLDLICPNGHEIKMSVEGFKEGDRCKICANINSYLTYDFVKEYIEKEGCILISKEYINSKEKLDMICNNGHSFKISWNQFNSGKRCRKCFNDRHRLEYDFVKNEIESIGYILVSKNYAASSKKLKMICNKGHIFMLAYSCFKNGIRCKKCSFTAARNLVMFKKAKNGHNLLNLYPEIALEWDYSLNDVLPELVPPKSMKKYMWICPKGHNSYLASVVCRTRTNTGCPICSSSKGEKAIEKFLKENNIDFIHQYKFLDCINKRALPFDFMIDRLGEKIICEFNGAEHFSSIKFFGGEEHFKDRIRNDEIKRNYCKEKGIKIIDIPYWEFNNISEILYKELDIPRKEVALIE